MTRYAPPTGSKAIERCSSGRFPAPTWLDRLTRGATLGRCRGARARGRGRLSRLAPVDRAGAPRRRRSGPAATDLRDLLARCLDLLAVGRRDVASALAARDARSADLAPLLEVAARLRLTARPVPSASFRDASQSRLLAQIAAPLGPDGRHRDGRPTPPSR